MGILPRRGPHQWKMLCQDLRLAVALLLLAVARVPAVVLLASRFRLAGA